MTETELGVQLKDGSAASALFYQILKTATEAHPLAFKSVNFSSSASDFRRQYVDLLPRFEAARLNSDDPLGIAVELANGFADQMVYRSADQGEPLASYLETPVATPELLKLAANAAPGWQPRLSVGGESWSSLRELAAELWSRGLISKGASSAFEKLADTFGDAPSINLQGRKIVIFGASAEMAPTAQLLAAGADVLWIDLSQPDALKNSDCRGGTLYYPKKGIDLLTQPRDALAMIQAFAAGAAVDLCLYAYAPGHAREMRLSAAMNAIVNALPTELIASVTLLLSPTTATPLDHDDLTALAKRRASRPFWEAFLEPLGILGRGGGTAAARHTPHTVGAASRTVVAIQGASYQAAQYLGKLMTAITWQTRGQLGKSNPRLMTVSANTAAITQTKSLAHPVFDAAFAGASALGVRTLTPLESQTLNGMLAINDWLNPSQAVTGKVRIHGGIHTLPYPLNTALRVAAGIGFIKKPAALLGLIPQKHPPSPTT